MAKDHKNQLALFKCCPPLPELNRALRGPHRGLCVGSQLPSLINILAGGYALGGNLPSFLDPHQKAFF